MTTYHFYDCAMLSSLRRVKRPRQPCCCEDRLSIGSREFFYFAATDQDLDDALRVEAPAYPRTTTQSRQKLLRATFARLRVARLHPRDLTHTGLRLTNGSTTPCSLNVQGLAEHFVHHMQGVAYQTDPDFYTERWARWANRAYRHREPHRSLIGKEIGLNEEGDNLAHHLEALMLTFYNICRARNFADRFATIATHAKMTNTGISKLGVSITVMISALNYFFPRTTAGDVSSDELDTQGLDFAIPTLDDVDDILSFYKNIKSSQAYTKVYRFFMYALSLSMFDSIGITLDTLKFEPVAQEAIRRKFHLGEDFFLTVLDTMVFLCKRGYQCYQAGSVLPMFHTCEKYQQWLDKAEILDRRSRQLGNARAHGFDRFTYFSDLKDTIEKGESIAKFAAKKEDRFLVKKMLSTLKLNYDDEVTKRHAMQMRMQPMSILVNGTSAVGKSSFVDILYMHTGKIRKNPIAPEYRYTKNPTEEFWSGLTTSHWCIVLDDISFINPKLGVLDPSSKDILNAINNQPYITNQAELNDKGRIPILAELLVATTNVKHLNAEHQFSCPVAVQRRFPITITLSVKREYENPDQPGMLDSSKRPASVEGQYDDLWNILVERIVPLADNPDKGRFEEVATFTSLREFLPWYNKKVEEHFATQAIVKESLEHVRQTPLCACGMPANWCTCMPTQAAETITTLAVYDEHGRPDPTFLDNVELDASTATAIEFLGYSSVVVRIVVVFYYCLYKYVFCSAWLNVPVTLFFGANWFWMMVLRSKHKWAVSREIFGYLGTQAQDRFGNRAFLGKCLVAISAAAVAYKGGSKLWDLYQALYTQGANLSAIGRAPIPDGREKPVVTYADPLSFSNADLSQTSLCSKGRDPSEIRRYIEEATVVLISRTEGRMYQTTAVNVRCNVYMCNNHSVPPHDNFTIEMVHAPSETLHSGIRNVLVTPNMIHRYPEHDLAFIRLQVRPPGSDITAYFCEETYNGKVDGTYVGRDLTGKIWSEIVRNCVLEDRTWRSTPKEAEELLITRPVWLGKVNNPTDYGQCGTILWANTLAGHTFLGIHTLGRGSTAAAMKVSRKMVTDACDRLEPKFVNRGQVVVSAPSVKRTLGPLVAQSSVHKCNPGVANVLGSFTNEFRQKSKTNVGLTIIADACRERGYPIERTAPNMTRTPWILALNDMTRPVTQLRSDVLEDAQEDFLRIPHKNLHEVHVYSLDVALNGAPGVLYCDKMNRATSAGAPYKCPKRKFLFFVDEENSTDVDITDEIKGEIVRIIDTYHRGERAHPVYCGHLKDEPVTVEKAMAGKTRVFTASGISHTLVVRMYLLSVIIHMQNHRFDYEMGPGTIVQSLEWEEIYLHLTHHGKNRIVAGDYSKFDKRMPANVILAAFDIIIHICEQAGYTDEDIRVVRGIAYDTAFPVVDFSGDLIEFFGSNPSGHPLTVIVNGLANSLYMRYVFLILRPPSSTQDFRSHVRLMTYGDDNIMGVSEDTPWFNHTAIQKVLADVDIGYTMADKEAASVPYIDISEANFLKRTWRYDEDIGAWVAPLDRSSIAKMLTTCVVKKNISPQAHAVDVIGTAMREYFWYGKQEFHERQKELMEIAEECGLFDYLRSTTFPSWDTLVDTFWKNSRHIRKREVAGDGNQLGEQPIDKSLEDGPINDLIVQSISISISDEFSERSEQQSPCYFSAGVASPYAAPRSLQDEYSTSLVARMCGCMCCATRKNTEVLTPLDLEAQADEVAPISNAAPTDTTRIENVRFHDAAGGDVGGLDVSYDGISAGDQTQAMDLKRFLSRPVRIANFTWLETDPVGTSHVYNPWNLFFTDARVKYKLNNFAFIQCKLKIKVMINASPFYYGAMLVSYQPLQNFCPSTIVNDTGTRYFIPYSQRPHAWLNPQNNEGAELTLPYFNNANWINAQSAQAMTDMGQLTFLNYTALASANGAVGAGVSVAVYAWAEDVKLSGPSVGLAVQSDVTESLVVQGDEYGEGVISAPASAIAAGAKWFEDIPFIGRFATATRIGASAVSSIASMFGFTNVPVIADTHPVRTECFPKLASSEIGYPVEKLSLDPKNELSVDPTIVGLTGEDELAIGHLVQKESYLATATWSTTNNVDDILFTSTVSPACGENDGATNSKRYLTPMAWVAALFQHWRGDIIFRFKIVASPFHKGRVRISYDPSGYSGENLTNDAASNNVVFTEIVDLGNTNEVEFRIPYQQATSFLTVPNLNNLPYHSTSASPTFLHNGANDNGTITMRVLTGLTAPVSASSVSVLVFVRGAENLEFANPSNVPAWTPLAVQSDVVETVGTGEPEMIKERYLVNFGECVRSLRQVLRRTTLVSTSTFVTDTTHDWCILKRTQGKIPPTYGYDPAGISSAKGLVATGSNFNFNYTQPHPLTWVLPAFVGYRGSTIWTFNVDAPTPLAHVRVQRINNNGGITYNEGIVAATKGTRSADAAFFYTNCVQGSAGQALTNQFTQAGISVTAPMFSQYRFQSTNPLNATYLPYTDGTAYDAISLDMLTDGVAGVASTGVRLWSYCGIGTDFGPHFFLNVPTLWRYSAVPTAN